MDRSVSSFPPSLAWLRGHLGKCTGRTQDPGEGEGSSEELISEHDMTNAHISSMQLWLSAGSYPVSQNSNKDGGQAPKAPPLTEELPVVGGY